MRRVHAILAIVALLAAPWALVARSFAAPMADCNGYCCLPHGSQSHSQHSHPQRPSKKLASDAMQCHHGSQDQMLPCSMRSGNAVPDYGLAAPIVPATPSAQETLAPPESARSAVVTAPTAASSGFLARPFQPPRA